MSKRILSGLYRSQFENGLFNLADYPSCGQSARLKSPQVRPFDGLGLGMKG
jgi:hypothetical protein